MKIASTLAALALAMSMAHATPFTITSKLIGDPRLDNPDNLMVDVTISGDTTSNITLWEVDINSPAHPTINLHSFYFNLSGLVADYSFSGFNPIGWNITSPANNAQGSGGADFMFVAEDPPGPGNNVTNSIDLTFTVTRLTGNWNESLFFGAPFSSSNDTTLGSGQLGAHLRSLTTTGNCGNSTNCSDSGFAFGEYRGRITEIPEPTAILLVGTGLLGMAFARRRNWI